MYSRLSGLDCCVCCVILSERKIGKTKCSHPDGTAASDLLEVWATRPSLMEMTQRLLTIARASARIGSSEGDSGARKVPCLPYLSVWEKERRDGMSQEDIESREAAHGKRMIEIRVRFWTDTIAKGKRKVIPKHCLDYGVVRIGTNSVHGIGPGKALHFASLMELPVKIEQLLRTNGLRLHHGPRSKKYYHD